MKKTTGLIFIFVLITPPALAQCMAMPPGPERRACVMNMRGAGAGGMAGGPSMQGRGIGGGGRDAAIMRCREQAGVLGSTGLATKDYMRSCMESMKNRRR